MKETREIKLLDRVFDAWGNTGLLDRHLVGLLSSRRVPGMPVLDAANRCKDLAGPDQAVVSGFHSPVESMCLDIMALHGTAMIAILAARLIPDTLPETWQNLVRDHRLLVLSPFIHEPVIPTRKTAMDRNRIVVDLAATLYFPYIESGSDLQQLAESARNQGKVVWVGNEESGEK